MDPMTVMAFGFGAQALSQFGNAYSQSRGIKAQAAYQRNVAEINSKLADLKGEDALQRGEDAARDYKKQVNRMIGSQRAAFAAQGVDVGYGSAADIQADTATQGELDILTIRSNAFREAWGYKVEANNYTAQGQFAEMGGNMQANNTLLTGGVAALGSGLQAYSATYGGSRKTTS